MARRHLAVLIVIASCGAAMSAQNDEETAFYTAYTPAQLFYGDNKNPTQVTIDVSLGTCRSMRARGSFALYIHEDDALRKLARFGPSALDNDDRKWIGAFDNRKAACERLFNKFEPGLTQRLKSWIRKWLDD